MKVTSRGVSMTSADVFKKVRKAWELGNLIPLSLYLTYEDGRRVFHYAGDCVHVYVSRTKYWGRVLVTNEQIEVLENLVKVQRVLGGELQPFNWATLDLTDQYNSNL